MCGIIGVVSDRKKGARDILVNGLARLEYRGYDSAGIALVDESTVIYKTAGRVKDLQRMVESGADAGTGIGHTRWATHGPPTQANAHPHMYGRVVLVHNGIIENFQELRQRIGDAPDTYQSETDTEVIAHLFDKELASHLEANDHLTAEKATAAFRATVAQLRGAYALVASIQGLPEVLFAAREKAPLLAGVGSGQNFFGSDATAIIEHTQKVRYLEDGDIAVATPDKITVTTLDGSAAERPINQIDWDLEDAQKGGFEHFMLKEIYDGPRAVRDCVAGRVHIDPPHVRLGTDLPDDVLKAARRILVVACGTSYHAGMVGKHVIESLTGIPVDVAYSSEYRYGPEVHDDGNLTIAISQSGETADTLAALREARARGHRVLALTNVVGSTIARESDGVLYIRSGPEIGVAATKSFLGQLAALYLIAFRIAELHGTLSADRLRELSRQLEQTNRLVDQVLEDSDRIKALAEKVADAHSCFFLGRQILYPVALEGALKLKEISYIHAEGYSGGELKHGPFALLTDQTPVIALLAPDEVYPKMVSNIIEVKARGPKVIVVTTQDDTEAEQVGDHVMRVPHTDPLFQPIVHSAALHLFAYWVAEARGCEIDKPRNLAKSVTVE